jgi:large repetitive protein
LKIITSSRSGVRIAVVAFAAALAVPLAVGQALAGPAAPASIASSDWTQVTLPSGYYVSSDPVPISCVAGTGFCLTVPSDNGGVPTSLAHPEPLVTTDGGTSWTGYATMPTQLAYVNAVSCATTSACWAGGYSATGTPDVAASTDGGKTWTDKTPAGWPSQWQILSMDCLSATNCWMSGDNFVPLVGLPPMVAETADGGATWTIFPNLPTITPYDPNGSYQLSAISCTSALDCVAAGGLDYSDGLAQVISTTDGGATWTLSTDPTLQGLQEIFSLSCLPGADGLPDCTAAGDALEAAGPVVISSADGGATWTGMETYDNTGWMNSVSCADSSHCWAAGGGTNIALVGTSNGGTSWSDISADTSNLDGLVSCPTVSFCALTTDDALWVTTDDGGLSPGNARGAASSAGLTVSRKAVSRSLPEVSGPRVSARATGRVTVTGQDRLAGRGAKVTVSVQAPSGNATTATTSIGENRYYSLTLRKLARGTTTLRFAVGGHTVKEVRVHAYAAAAPAIRALSVHAGPVSGHTTITVTGINFRHVTGVSFGSKRGTRVHVLSATRLTVQAAAGTGARFVTVATADGGPSALTGKAVYNYLQAPRLTSLSPAAGKSSGGTTVTITGSWFGFVKAVYFGTRPAAHVRVISAREIKVTTPKGNGSVRVKVVTAGGVTAPVPGDRFTY